jgi:hypothetical protein
MTGGSSTSHGEKRKKSWYCSVTVFADTWDGLPCLIVPGFLRTTDVHSPGSEIELLTQDPLACARDTGLRHRISCYLEREKKGKKASRLF